MTEVLLLGLLLAAAIGAALGSIGSGGAILALPILVYVLGVPPASAVPMSMVLVGAASLGTSFLKWRQEALSWKAMSMMSSTGLVGAYWGSGLTRLVSSATLMVIFAVILVAVGTLMFTNPERRLRPRSCQVSRCMIAGGLIGVLTGFLGVGGGFLLVPTLVFFGGFDLRRATGTSAGIISVNSLAGVVGHLRFSTVDWRLTGLLLVSTAVGVVVGVSAAQRVSEAALRRALAVLTIVIGIWVGFTAIASF